MKTVCVWVPDFAVALARRNNSVLRGRPVVAGGSPEEHAQVRACSSEAREAGVEVGTTLRRALALCPGAAFLPWRESEIQREAARLVAVLQEQSPVVEAIEPGHAHVDVRGLHRMYDTDEEGFLRDLQATLEQESGLAVRMAAAETIFAAHAGATMQGDLFPAEAASAPLLIQAEELRDFLAGLPVEVLPVPVAMHQRLRLFGLKTLGSIGRLPFSAVQAQFGRDGARAWRLANGEDNARIVARAAEPRLVEELDLPAPSPLLDPLVVGSRALLNRALSRPAVRGYLLRTMNWQVVLESGEVISRQVVFREPTNDEERMLFVLKSKIASLRLPGAAASLRLELSGLCSEYGQQAPLWATGPKRQRELFEAIEQLNTREQGTQVFRIVEVEPWSRIPERQLALMPYAR
jgi:nucleotidyltransferase/DNA polymerase involved in DNA repair